MIEPVNLFFIVLLSCWQFWAYRLCLIRIAAKISFVFKWRCRKTVQHISNQRLPSHNRMYIYFIVDRSLTNAIRVDMIWIMFIWQHIALSTCSTCHCLTQWTWLTLKFTRRHFFIYGCCTLKLDNWSTVDFCQSVHIWSYSLINTEFMHRQLQI